VAVKAALPRRRVNSACSNAELTSGVVFDDDTRQPEDPAGVDVGDEGDVDEPGQRPIR
jgi:hypothetical protein